MTREQWSVTTMECDEQCSERERVLMVRGKGGASVGKAEQRVPTVRKLCGERGNGGDRRRGKKEPKQRCDNEAALVGIGEKIGVGGNRRKPKGKRWR